MNSSTNKRRTIVKVPSKVFDYYKKKNVFYADISRLEYEGYNLPISKDEGEECSFVMISEWTGKEEEFKLRTIERDPEGDDILKWTYEATINNKSIWVFVFNT